MTNAEARFNNSLRPRKPEGSLGRTAQDGHLDSHTAPELCVLLCGIVLYCMCGSSGCSMVFWVHSFVTWETVVWWAL